MYKLKKSTTIMIGVFAIWVIGATIGIYFFNKQDSTIPPAPTNWSTYICQSDPDYFTKRCTIHPYSITKVIDGVVQKWHLVGCQFKSFSCINWKCVDNFWSKLTPYEVSFEMPMDSYEEFCNMLCRNPACTDGWKQ